MSIVLPGHCRRIATVTVLASWLLAFTVAAQAQLPPVRVDDDHDGIDDALEQLLAERYAPVIYICLLYTSPSPRDGLLSRMPSSA